MKPAQTLLCQYFLPSSALILESGACEALPWSGSDMVKTWATTKLGVADTGASSKVCSPSSLCPGWWWCGKPARRGARECEGDRSFERSRTAPTRQARLSLKVGGSDSRRGARAWIGLGGFPCDDCQNLLRTQTVEVRVVAARTERVPL